MLPAAALTALALLLAGCVAEPSPGLTVLPDRPSATPVSPSTTEVTTAPPVDPVAGCVDGVSRISGSSQSVAFAGECARLEISGNDLAVDLTGATTQEIVVRGDRNDVDAIAAGALDIEGNDNTWSGPSLGSLTLRGDRNVIDLTADLGAAAVGGNDNVITAGILGSVDDSGQRNSITTR